MSTKSVKCLDSVCFVFITVYCPKYLYRHSCYWRSWHRVLVSLHCCIAINYSLLACLIIQFVTLKQKFHTQSHYYHFQVTQVSY